MKEIILEKRYPHSREEDITDAFMRGYEIGKEQEHRWWSTFCANCKTDNCSEIPNNSAEQDEPQTQLTAKCLNCNNSKACKEKHWEDCRYEPLGYEVTAVVGTIKDEPTTQTKTQNSNLTFEKDECAKEYEELGLKELKELIEADCKTEQTEREGE